MKKQILTILVGLFVLGGIAHGEGLYVSTGVGAGTFDERPIGQLGLRLGTDLLSWLEGGVHGTAFHTLEREYTDEAGRTYQAESGYTALYLRPHLRLGKRIDLGVTLSSGRGLLQYRYSHEYRDELTWAEELLDRVDFGVQSVGADIKLNLCDVHALSVAGGYRVSSPLQTPFANKGDWRSPYAAVRYTWRLF
jgi:hypothetical protein